MLITLRHVQAVKAPGGKTYYYHRPTRTRIKADPSSAEFVRIVEALNAKVDLLAPPGGTLGALIAAYVASPEHTALAPATRSGYRRVLDWLKPIEAMPLEQVTATFLLRLRDKAATAHKRRFANYVVQVVRLMLSWGAPRGFDCAPVKVPLIKRPKGPGANRPWNGPELAAVLKAAPEGVRAAVALGAYAGLREGDALRLPWTAWDGRVIRYRQAKTGQEVVVRAHRALAAILEATPRRADEIVTGERGRRFTDSGFRAVFFRVLLRLRAAGSVEPGLTFHGLRHTAATALAEAGAGTRDIMAVTGHKTEAMVANYVARAETARRADRAVALVEAAECKKSGEEL